jgi:site-specific recombinase XerC
MFRRKADAERFAREVEVDMDRGQWIDPRGADVALEQWVETFMTFAQSLAPTTQQTYKRDLDRYILPRFGAVRLGRRSPEEVEIWLNDELAKGLAPSSVHRHYRTLRRVLQTAVEKDRLLTNPCDRVRPPKVPKTAMTVLTWE